MKPKPKDKILCACEWCQEEPGAGLSLFIWAVGLLFLAAWAWWG